MKVDTYHSTKKPSYGLVVPTGTDLTRLQGAAGRGVASLSPLTLQRTNVELSDVYKGDLREFLENQIAQEGAGLVKIVVGFDEVISN
jgi:hypothetical protein